MPKSSDHLSKSASQSGITTSATGERHIPSSTRADGSLRKEIRVRPGYRPPEDVEVYKNKASQISKSRGQGGVPGAVFVPDRVATTRTKTVRSPQTDDRASIATSAGNGGYHNQSTSAEVLIDEIIPPDPEAEKEKEAKKLSKRLRQARDLELKKDKGDTLLPEQFEKVIRINELIRQLNGLGFDAEGQRKV